MLQHTADQLPPGPVIMIGDSETDAETAVAAGVPFLLHTEGYRLEPGSRPAARSGLLRLRRPAGARRGPRSRPTRWHDRRPLPADSAERRPAPGRRAAPRRRPALVRRGREHRRDSRRRAWCRPRSSRPTLLSRLTRSSRARLRPRASTARASWLSSTSPPTASPTAGSTSPCPQRSRRPARLADAGADFLDIGGESTRPGRRAGAPSEGRSPASCPVIAALRADGFRLPISIDTRNAVVAPAAFDAGADLFNDVSALTHDPPVSPLAAASGRPVCADARPGRPPHHAGRPHLRRRASGCRRLPRSPRRRRRGRRHSPRAPPRRSRHRLRQDHRPQSRADPRASRCCTDSAAPILFGASRKRFIGDHRQRPGPGRRACPARSPLRWKLCARAHRCYECMT